MNWEIVFFWLGIVLLAKEAVSFLVSYVIESRSKDIEIRRQNIKLKAIDEFSTSLLKTILCFSALYFAKLKYMWLVFAVVLVFVTFVKLLILVDKLYLTDFFHKYELNLRFEHIKNKQQFFIYSLILKLYLWLYSWRIIFV